MRSILAVLFLGILLLPIARGEGSDKEIIVTPLDHTLLAQKPSRKAKPGTSVYLDFVDIKTGAQMRLGGCPCYRVTTKTTLISGKIETKHFLIKSKGLVDFDFNSGLNFRTRSNVTKDLFNVGASEIIWKDQRLGIYFPGLTFGRNIDQGYTDIYKTGLYLMLLTHLSQDSQIDFRIGYRHQQGVVNLFREFEEDLLSTSFNVAIAKGRQRFGFSLVYDLMVQTKKIENPALNVISADVFYEVEILRTNYVDFHAGVAAHGEINSIREQRHHLSPYDLSLQLYLGGRFHNKVKRK